jgi:hypothetical protein
MKEYKNQTFKDRHLAPGKVFANASFERCVFDGCAVFGPGTGPGTVRNVTAKKCTYKGTTPFNTILEDVTIEDLTTGSATLAVSDCLFKHVTLKGKLDTLFIKDLGPRVDSKKYYAEVDWALDLREAEFRDLDLRGVPPDLIRRDPDTQIVVWRKDAMKTDRWQELPYSVWRGTLKRLTGERVFREYVVLVPAKRGKDYEDQLASVRMLKKLGLAK